MPDKHLFVNSSHYQDRPDSNMRHRIASHAAKYGPNGSMTYKTTPERSFESVERAAAKVHSKSFSTPSPSTTSTPRVRSASVISDPSPNDASFGPEYEALSASLSTICICPTPSNGSPVSGKAAHTAECCLLDDYLTLAREHELPFRVATNVPQSVGDFSSSPFSERLVLQCLLVVGQAVIDGMDPKFKGKPSKQTLALQQKALSAMQRSISENVHTIDDSIVLASAVMLSVAAYYADHDAYKTHHSSLRKLIQVQGGFKQTKPHIIVKTLIAGGDISFANHQYLALEKQTLATRQTSLPQSSNQTPFKLKYSMPPFAPEITNLIDKMSPGFRSLAKKSTFSVQALTLIHSVCKWSLLINQPLDSETEEELLLEKNAGAEARLLQLYDESTQTKRIATLLLISIPPDAAHMKLERCVCLGIINLLHSVALRPHTTPLRDQLVVDFAESLTSFQAKSGDEEDAVIWLGLAVASEWRHCAAKLKESPLPAQHGYDSIALSQIWIQKSRQVMDWLIVKYERARAWEDLDAVCSRFLWLQRLGDEWRDTWERAMERRLRNMPRKKSRS